MINSRSKGKRGELELSHWLTERGVTAFRGQQFAGGPDSPDVVTSHPVFENIRIECKRVDRVELDKWVTRAEKDAGPHWGVVFWRRNRERWKVSFRLSSWVERLPVDNLDEFVDSRCVIREIHKPRVNVDAELKEASEGRAGYSVVIHYPKDVRERGIASMWGEGFLHLLGVTEE